MALRAEGITVGQPDSKIQIAGLGVLQLEAVKLFDFDTSITVYCVDLTAAKSFPRSVLVGLDGLNFVFDRRFESFSESVVQFSNLLSIIQLNAVSPVITIHYNDVADVPSVDYGVLESEWNLRKYNFSVGDCADPKIAADALASTLQAVMQTGKEYVDEIQY
jgi:hypothetical protein